MAEDDPRPRFFMRLATHERDFCPNPSRPASSESFKSGSGGPIQPYDGIARQHVRSGSPEPRDSRWRSHQRHSEEPHDQTPPSFLSARRFRAYLLPQCCFTFNPHWPCWGVTGRQSSDTPARSPPPSRRRWKSRGRDGDKSPRPPTVPTAIASGGTFAAIATKLRDPQAAAEIGKGAGRKGAGPSLGSSAWSVSARGRIPFSAGPVQAS
jgi:hypothetical protein